MGINFHDSSLSSTYSSREADPEWLKTVRQQFNLKGAKALDLGCGGGIYSKALAELGAREVVGVDFSASMLDGAAANCAAYNQISFLQGDAAHTGLKSQSFDFILMRALIHHLPDLSAVIEEANRLLRPGGRLLIQDRTPEDCLLPGDARHIRGYFFEAFPRLIPIELKRRHESGIIQSALRIAGFQSVNEETFWETRRVYPGAEAFRADLLARTGRSILHELTDAEMLELANWIESKMKEPGSTDWLEQDRWTIWTAGKTGGRL